MKKFFIVLISFSIFVSEGFSILIDDFSSVSDWQVQGDGGLKVSVSSSGYFDSSCMIFSYNLTEREWVQIWKDFSVKNFSYGDTLKFWFYGEGEKNNLEIKLEDKDGSVFVKTLYGVTDTTSWSEVKIPFDEFKCGRDEVDKVLDTTKIKKISFGVTKLNGGKGYIVVDEVELYVSTSAVKIFDNFDDLDNTNNFGGTNWPWGSTCTVVYVSTEKYSGTGAVEVSYDVTAGSTVYAGFILHLNKQQIRPATYLSFYVKTAGSGCQNFRVKFEDYDNNRNWGKEVPIESYISLSSQWQRVDIPLADFDDFISTYTVHPGGMKLNFVFGYNFGPPFSGKVYIDEIKFYIPDLPEGATAKIIDTMDELVNKLCSWSTYGDALINIESVNGYKNKGIKLNYDFTFAKDSYGVMERNMSLNFSNFNIIQLRYKGQTNNNNFEFKLTDSDGTCYLKKIFNLPDSTDWQTIKIPIRELSLFREEKEDANSDLDLKNITKLYIVLSKSSYDKENKGVVYFDNLELSIEPDYEVEKKYIEKFEVVNNPFSPNGDGVKDTVRFVYKLKDYSTVKLEIFTLRGERVKVFNEGEKLPSQEHTIEWNGRDDDKNLLRNGIYIYRFSIKTLDGKEEEIKHIIGIIK